MKKLFVIVLLLLLVVIFIILLGNFIEYKKVKKMISYIDEKDYASLSNYAIDNKKTITRQVAYHSDLYCDVMLIPVEDLFPPLHYACYTGDVCAVKIFLDLGVDVNSLTKYGNCSPLMACMLSKSNEFIDMANLLLDYGADPTMKFSIDNTDALCRCIYKAAENEADDSSTMYALLTRLISCCGENYTFDEALCCSARNSSITTTKIILDNCFITVNDSLVVNGSLWADSLLHYAASVNSSYDYVCFLLSSGADIYMIDSNGKTAYDYAIENNNLIIASLIKPI